MTDRACPLRSFKIATAVIEVYTWVRAGKLPTDAFRCALSTRQVSSRIVFDLVGMTWLAVGEINDLLGFNERTSVKYSPANSSR